VLASVIEEPALVRLVSRAGVDTDAVAFVVGILRIANDECQMAAVGRPGQIRAVVSEARELPRLAARKVEDEDVARRTLPPLWHIAAVRRERESLAIGRPLRRGILRDAGGDLGWLLRAVR